MRMRCESGRLAGAPVSRRVPPDSRACGLERPLVHEHGRRGILEGNSRAVENDRLVLPLPAGDLPGNDIGEIAADVLAPQQSRGDRVMELAEGGALVELVDDQPASGQEPRIELLLLRAVGAHGGEERAGSEISREENCLPRGSAGDDRVALGDGGSHVLSDDRVDAECAHKFRGERRRPAGIGVAEEQPFEGQHVEERMGLSSSLCSTSDDCSDPRVLPGEELRRNGGGSPGALNGDLDRVHHGERRSAHGIREKQYALDRGKPEAARDCRGSWR